MSAFGWTQPICFACFKERHPGREPVELIEPDLEVCVHCGKRTYSGIYTRVDPKSAAHPTLSK